MCYFERILVIGGSWVYHVETTTFAKGNLVGSLLVSERFAKNPFLNQHFILAISPVIGIIESAVKTVSISIKS